MNKTKLSEIEKTYEKAHRVYDKFQLQWEKGADIFSRLYRRQSCLKYLIGTGAPKIIVKSEELFVKKAKVAYQDFQSKMEKVLKKDEKIFDKARKLAHNLPKKLKEKYYKKLDDKMLEQVKTE